MPHTLEHRGLSEPGGKGLHKILVIDDDPRVRGLLVDWTEAIDPGAEITACSNGAEGIDRLDDEAFDLVVTDLNMPRKSGLDVANYMKTRSPATPIVLVSGTWTPEERRQAGGLNLHALLEKPLSFDGFSSEVRRALNIADD